MSVELNPILHQFWVEVEGQCKSFDGILALLLKFITQVCRKGLNGTTKLGVVVDPVKSRNFVEHLKYKLKLEDFNEVNECHIYYCTLCQEFHYYWKREMKLSDLIASFWVDIEKRGVHNDEFGMYDALSFGWIAASHYILTQCEQRKQRHCTITKCPFYYSIRVYGNPKCFVQAELAVLESSHPLHIKVKELARGSNT
jgi:hypothetical protein